MASTDGVGTKVALARRAGRLDGLGIDLVAMCADDVACAGAEPLFLLDYVAVGRLVPAEVATIVAGVAAGCRLAGCTLLGGETAEHPGVMRPDDLDLAEQVQPLVSGVLGSAAGAVPGLHAASALFVNSVVNGTANAFLTLRVGIIAKRYCGALVLPEPRAVRRFAVSQAAQMLGAIPVRSRPAGLSRASAGAASTLTFTTDTAPAFSAAISASTGARRRHGPHQAA